jgi:hypothetical protein
MARVFDHRGESDAEVMSAKPGVRWIHAALVAALVSALAPGVAVAVPPLVDDAVADFAAGSGTSTWIVEPGLALQRPTSEGFDGSGLPAGLTETPLGVATVSGGTLTVSNGRVNGAATGPETLEFRATFGADDRQHIGVGETLNNAGPWAIFSTGGPGLAAGLWVRTQVDAATKTEEKIAETIPFGPHVYRIERGPTSVRYFVDGALVATHLHAITAQLPPIVSDGSATGTVTVDWLGGGAAAGVFESRVHDAATNRVDWGAVSTTPGDVAIETSTGDTATPDGTWSNFEPTDNGEIVSPPGRYIQYRATLDDDESILDRVEISYAIVSPRAVIDDVQMWDGDATVFFHTPDAGIDDFECSIDGGAFAWCSSPFVFRNLTTGTHTVGVRAHDELGNPPGAEVYRTFDIDATPPSVVIGASQVNGSTATTSFRSPDADAQVFECSLDSGPFQTCTSPASFSGLAVGPHTIRVRARDVAGNTGASDAWGFSVKPPGSGTQAGEDDSAPVLKLPSRRVRATSAGWVKVKVGCPAYETRCRLTLRAGSGKKKTATVAGGKTVKVPVKLTAATRRKLADRGQLKVTIRIVARDDSGNRRIREYRFTVLAPR